MSGASVLYTFSGLDVATPANGNQTSPTQNRIVTLSFAGSDKFDTTGLRFRSTSLAFEFDNVNVSISAVPEPATWGMLLLGFGLVGAGMRSRKRAMVLA